MISDNCFDEREHEFVSHSMLETFTKHGGGCRVVNKVLKVECTVVLY